MIVFPALATAAEVLELKSGAMLSRSHKLRAESLKAVGPVGHTDGLRLVPLSLLLARQSMGHGRMRMPVTDALDAAGVATCDSLLLRAISLLDAAMPLLTQALFPLHATLSATTCIHNPNLVFSTNEPAINIYTEGGGFGAHEDKQSLTVLVNLSTAGVDFQGGGTLFWSKKAACDPDTGRGSFVNEPTMTLCPPAGSALIFGGTVTHAGQRVLGGQRVVFVASFSPLSEAATAAVAATAIATTAIASLESPGRHYSERCLKSPGEALGERGGEGGGRGGGISSPAPPPVEASLSSDASEREVYLIKQQRLRDQRNAYEARVEAERERKLALVASLESLSLSTPSRLKKEG